MAQNQLNKPASKKDLIHLELRTDRKFEMLKREMEAHRQETTNTSQQIMTILDKIATTVNRLDQERIFTIRWVERIEKEIEGIKKHLKIN
jgi:hypothetical protein